MTAIGALQTFCIASGAAWIIAEAWAGWQLWTAERRREAGK